MVDQSKNSDQPSGLEGVFHDEVSRRFRHLAASGKSLKTLTTCWTVSKAIVIRLPLEIGRVTRKGQTREVQESFTGKLSGS